MADVRLNADDELDRYRTLCSIGLPAEHYLKHEFDELLGRKDILRFLDGGTFNGFWLRDLDSREDEWISPGFWRSLGYDPATRPHKTRAWQAIAFREDHEQAQRDLVRHCANPAHPYDQFIRFRTAAGDFATMRCRGFALREGGHPTRMFGVNTLVGESDAVGLSPLANDIFEQLDDAVILWSDRRGVQRWNAGARALYGYGEDEVLGRDPSAVLGHTLNAEWDDVMEVLYAGRQWRGELSLHAKSGAAVAARTTIRRAAQIGDETLFVQVSRDERAVRESAARQTLALRELNHRVKNIFSVVASLILMSSRIEGDRPEFAENLRRRISALAQTHATSLGPDGGERPAARDVVTRILRAYAVDDARLTVTGGDEPLAIAQLTPFGLLINELGARCSTSGVWADPVGAVHIDIGRTTDGWTLTWRETAALAPRERPPAEGFGEKLIGLSAMQLSGKVTESGTAEAHAVTISFPVADEAPRKNAEPAAVAA